MTIVALSSLYGEVQKVDAAPRTKRTPSTQPINVPSRISIPHQVYGPHKVTAEQMRALLSPTKTPPLPSADEEANEGYEVDVPAFGRIRITDPTLRAKAEGQSQPKQKPHPNNAPPQTPAPALTWEAPGLHDGSEPPDPQIAASTTHVVVAAQHIMGFFQKDGTPLGTVDYENFFEPLGLATGTDTSQGLPSFLGSDPRLIFDEYRKVFWLVHSGSNKNPPTSVARHRIYVAVSTSEDPLGAWNLYWWDSVAEWHIPNSTIFKLGDLADYPSVGVDPVAFHQTIAVCNRVDTSNASTPCNPRYAGLVVAPAQDLVNGTEPPGQYKGSYFIFTDPIGNKMTGVVQPTVHHGKTDYAFYVGRWGNNQLTVWRIKPPMSAQPTQATDKPRLVTMTSPFAGFSAPPDAPQKGSNRLVAMSNLGTSPLKSVYREGLLHVVTNDARDWFNDGTNLNSIHLVRFSVKEWPNIPTTGKTFINRIFGMNNIFDDNPEKTDHMYYGWPAIEVNKNGNMIIVYARTGTTIYPQERFSAYYNSEPDVRPSRLLHAGDGPYTGYAGSICGPSKTLPCPFRYGDLAGASVDPEDDTSIWMVHEYPTTGPKANWGIWVGKVIP